MTTQQLLGMTQNEYEMAVLSNYLTWCKNHNAANDAITQRLLASPHLFNWWLQEYKSLEQAFEKMAKPYAGIITKAELVDMYKNEMMQIHGLYSKPLIYTSRYKHQNISNHINN